MASRAFCRFQNKVKKASGASTKAPDDTRLSDSLAYFKQQSEAKHAFQAVMEMPFVAVDRFSRTDPMVVPARTLLSQLL